MNRSISRTQEFHRKKKECYDLKNYSGCRTVNQDILTLYIAACYPEHTTEKGYYNSYFTNQGNANECASRLATCIQLTTQKDLCSVNPIFFLFLKRRKHECIDIVQMENVIVHTSYNILFRMKVNYRYRHCKG